MDYFVKYKIFPFNIYGNATSRTLEVVSSDTGNDMPSDLMVSR